MKSSSASASASTSNKMKLSSPSRISEGAQYNIIINGLKSLNYAEGLKYITNNNLQEWLKTQIDSEAEMTTEDLWLTFYENNIYKEPNSIEKGNLNSGLPVTIRGKQLLFKKRKNITHKNIGGASSSSSSEAVDDYFNRNWNTLTVLTLKDNNGIEVCKVYGSSLPKNSGIPELYDYFYKMGIKDIISFQDCDNTLDRVHKNSCLKLGYNEPNSISQASIWENIEKQKSISIQGGEKQKRNPGKGKIGKTWRGKTEKKTIVITKPKTRFIANEEKDMTAGSLSNFNILIQQPIWERPTLIHCLAGFGRTGTALLYYYIRTLLLYGIDGLNYTNLNQKYFRFTNSNCRLTLSSCVYNVFKIRFERSLSLHTDLKWEYAIVDGSNYHPSKMVEEVFKIDTISQANLFVTRINYILLYTALFLNAQTDRVQFPGIPPTPITHIYLYPLHTQYPQQQSGRIVSMFTPDYIFKNPNLVSINHFDAQNEYGLKLKNIPYI